MLSDSSQRSADLMQYVDALLEQRGVMQLQLDPADLQQMREDLYDDVDAHLRDYVISFMDDPQLAIFENLLSQGDDQKTQAHVAACVPNLESVVAEALVSFQMKYING